MSPDERRLRKLRVIFHVGDEIRVITAWFLLFIVTAQFALFVMGRGPEIVWFIGALSLFYFTLRICLAVVEDRGEELKRKMGID